MVPKNPALNPLNRRVWSLFEKAGFQTEPNSHDLKEHIVHLGNGNKRTLDLLAIAEDLGIRIIGWNKAQKDLGESLTVHIHDYLRLRDVTGATGVLFVSTSKEISPEHKAYALKHGVTAWGEEQIRYFEAVVGAVGHYARYEIIHALGLATQEEKNVHHTLALMFRQPYPDSATRLFQFTMSPEKLLKTCVIYRKALGSAAAYQRMVQKDRLRRIGEFVTKPSALLPTNLIVHLSNEVAWEPIDLPPRDSHGKPTALAYGGNYQLVVLKIPLGYASMELIDGQHRLFGFAGTDPATQKSFNLVVLGISELHPDMRRDTFVAINDNSRRMDPNLVAFLKYTEDTAECQASSELMAVRIVVELNRTSPFMGKIRLLDVGDEKVTLKGFSGYDLKGLIGPKGLLRKYHGDDPKDLATALRMYFGVLKSLFPKQWEAPDRYIIFTNRGISAFLKLLKSILKTTKGPIDPSTAQKYLKPIRVDWKDSKWEIELLTSAYIGSKGWKDFHRELVATVRKVYPSFKE